MPLIQISTPHFTAVLVAADGKVILAAPIIQYMLGWNGAEVARYCRSKGWSWKCMDASEGVEDASEGVEEDNDVSSDDLRE